MSEPATNYENSEPSDGSAHRTSIAYGSFWERLGAFLIDAIILSGIGFVLRLIFDEEGTTISIDESEGFSDAFKTTYFKTSNAISVVVGWLYYAIQESGAARATFGKRALGLEVTNINGEKISFLNATGRHFAKWISAIILFIGFLMMLWDDKRQALHDKIAGTLIIKRRN